LIRPFEVPPPDGYETPEHPLVGVDRHFRLTQTIRQAFPDLPVVGSGYSYLQEFFPQGRGRESGGWPSDVRGSGTGVAIDAGLWTALDPDG
jgi:hypothetical protein